MAKKTKQKKTDKAINPLSPDELFERFIRDIEQAKNNTGTWSANQDKWHRLRMCIKKVKNFPFIGCSNMRLPTVETKLRKAKSNLVKVIFGQRPVVQAIPSPSGDSGVAQKIEKFLDHLIMDKIKLKAKGVIAIDQTIEKGMYLLKPHWRTEITTRVEELKMEDFTQEEIAQLINPNTNIDMVKAALAERLEIDGSDLVFEDNDREMDRIIKELTENKTEFKIELKDVIYNCPDVALVSPEYFYVDGDAKWYVQDLRRMTQEYFLPFDTVKANVSLKGWSQSAIDKIDYFKDIKLDKQTDITKEQREGVQRLHNPSKLVRIYETYCYYDINNDGADEKCCFIFAPDFGVLLRKNVLSTDNMKFPFVKLVNELTDDRWFSHRGMPELIEDLVKEIDTQHNQKLDNQTLRNAPMVSYRAGVVNPNLIKFQPAQSVARHDPDDITFMNNTNLNVEFSYKDEQMILESKIEEVIGQLDFSLQSMINRRQPRTAFEVNQQQQNLAMVFSLDADIYAEAFSELFSDIWDLWCQYGDDDYEFSYFGDNGVEKIRLSREEVQGKYKIMIRGNDQNFNPQVRQEKASLILQALTNPVALQAGIIQPQNLYNGYRNYFQQLNIDNWSQLITDPSQLPPPPKPPAPVELKADNLTDAELAQVKQEQGIQPDVQGMAMKREDELRREMKEYDSPEPSNKLEN